MSGHAAVLLAAGGSRRLGRPKQLLTRDGEALVRRVARFAIATAPQRMLVVLGADHARIAPVLAALACEIVVNAAWERGLAGSIAAAHAALRDHAGAVLLSACDQPALAIAHFDALLHGAAQSDAGCAATAYGDALGVPAVVPVAMLAPGDGLAGDRGLGARLRALPEGACFPLYAPELAFDLDTEDDVRDAIARGWLDSEPAA